MTEFTIVGNLKEVNSRANEFKIEEGANEYLLHASKHSPLIEELELIAIGSRMKVKGIITKDENKKDIFVCNRATISLGIKGE